MTYIRSVFEYGAVVHFTHAAPVLRDKIEAEQNKCARIITGCILPTNCAALLAEADLPVLAVRAKELAATEVSRIARLPQQDLAKQLLGETPRPRLKYRTHEDWARLRIRLRGGQREPGHARQGCPSGPQTMSLKGGSVDPEGSFRGGLPSGALTDDIARATVVTVIRIGADRN